MKPHFRTQSPFAAILILAGLLVLLGAMVAISWQPRSVSASPVLAPLSQEPDNSACFGCHGQPGQTLAFPNGDTVSVEVSPDLFSASMHKGLACQTCHPNISGFPHPENSAQSAKEYTLQYRATCKQCHPGEAEQLQDSVHTKLLNEGNINTPICADCHSPHTQKAIQKDANGLPAPSEHANIALVCAKCHSAIYSEYIQSVHGSGIIENRNPDVPACTDCHGVHKITGPTGTNFRLTSPQICSKCHTDKTIMDKYGISTNVLRTYISDFHGTTVTLFEKIDPDQQTNKPVCFDCHGVHNITRVDDPQKGLEIKQNLLTTCKRCHPDATANFPDSWLSHYIPSPTKYPLVYYVQLFYYILIPVVLGGMAIFVISDIYRRLFIDRRKKKMQGTVQAADQSTPDIRKEG